MPEINAETPRESYTIDGDSFNVPAPYVEGHVLTAGEASQLNQVFAENVRNNLASKAKQLKEAGTYAQDVFQGTVDDYCDSYEMGVRTGGGRSTDPVTAEALNIAREMVRNAIKSQGKYKLSDITAKQITDLAKATIDKNPQIIETARARVEEVRAIAGIELSALDLGGNDSDKAPAKSKVKAAAE